MDTNKPPSISPNPWTDLQQFTPARIALGRAGNSLTTRAHLDFQLAHALARDSVHIPVDFSVLEQQLSDQGYPCLRLQSLAENQAMYLQRPDLGRLLASTPPPSASVDAVIVVADGLSSQAIARHAAAFLDLLLPALQQQAYVLAPVCLVKHARVAIGDAVAAHFNAKLCVVLVGERPGLSSPDSMGIYFTYQAQAGISTDADRNCISNIHHNGLSYQQALRKLLFLIAEAENLGYSGCLLKDETQVGDELLIVE